MTNTDIGMTRDEAQTEALVIESLLNAAMATFGAKDTAGMIELVEQAHDRSKGLQIALDSTTFKGEVQ